MSWRRCVRKRFSWRPFVGPYRFEKGRKPRRSRSDSPRNAALRKRFPMARCALAHAPVNFSPPPRSEEHTSELQSHSDLVCRLLLEKKKHKQTTNPHLT